MFVKQWEAMQFDFVFDNGLWRELLVSLTKSQLFPKIPLDSLYQEYLRKHDKKFVTTFCIFNSWFKQIFPIWFVPVHQRLNIILWKPILEPVLLVSRSQLLAFLTTSKHSVVALPVSFAVRQSVGYIHKKILAANSGQAEKAKNNRTCKDCRRIHT